MGLTLEQAKQLQDNVTNNRKREFIPLAPKRAESPLVKKGRKSFEENTKLIIGQKLSKPTEAEEHKQLVIWLKLQYPNLMFNTDMSGIKLTMGQAIKCASLRSHRAMPDLQIMKACNGYFGMFIELKRSGERLLKKDGTYASPHLEEQSKVIERLNNEGYFACFCIGLGDAKSAIIKYLAITK